MATEHMPPAAAQPEPGLADSDFDDSSRHEHPVTSDARWAAFQGGVAAVRESLSGPVEEVRAALVRLETSSSDLLAALVRLVARSSGREANTIEERARRAILMVLVWAKALEISHYSQYRCWLHEPADLAGECVVKLSRRLLSGKPVTFQCIEDLWRYLNQMVKNSNKDETEGWQDPPCRG